MRDVATSQLSGITSTQDPQVEPARTSRTGPQQPMETGQQVGEDYSIQGGDRLPGTRGTAGAAIQVGEQDWPGARQLAMAWLEPKARLKTSTPVTPQQINA